MISILKTTDSQGSVPSSGVKLMRKSTATPQIKSANEDLEKLNALFRGNTIKTIKHRIGGRSAYMQS